MERVLKINKRATPYISQVRVALNGPKEHIQNSLFGAILAKALDGMGRHSSILNFGPILTVLQLESKGREQTENSHKNNRS